MLPIGTGQRDDSEADVVATETAALPAVRPDAARIRLAAVVTELEIRPMSQFRTLPGPAAAAEREAADLGDEELVQRARLLQVGVQLRLGLSEEAGRAAHLVLDWAVSRDSRRLIARTHRELGIFYRQVGDYEGALKHAVECVSYLPEDTEPTIKARHLMSLATALDENDSGDEAERRFREGLAISTAIGDDELTLYILNNMAYTAYEKEDEPAASELIRAMREVEDRSKRPLSANELDTIARVELMTDRYDAVERTLAPVLLGSEATVVGNEGDAIAECLLTLAETRRLDGRAEDAQDVLDAARTLCAERNLAAVGARVRAEQAALFAATGRFREAYEEHLAFHSASTALHSIQREARARALQAVFEATEARRISDHFREMAHRDALTGLYNRRFINETVPAMLSEAAVRRTPISVAIVDLDHFKRVNDTLSHSTGDTVLQEIAQLLTAATTGGGGLAARMGGEEFLLVFPGVAQGEAARRCERLRLAIKEFPWQPITGPLPVTTSIGVTTAVDGVGTMAALLGQADRNLYTAKRGGRDQVVVDAG